MIISIVSGLKGTRTLTPFRAADFESTASTNSAMRPNCWRYQTRTDNLTSRVSRVANYTNPQNSWTIRIRTQTDRTKICGATITPWSNTVT